MLKIKKKSLMCFILLLPIFQPVYLEVMLAPLKIYQLLTLGCFTYATLHVFLKRKKISAMSFVLLFYAGTLVVSTILGNGYINNSVLYAAKISLIVLLFQIYADDMGVLLKSLMIYSEICVYINLLTILIAPDGFFSRSNSAYGMTEEWFLGADNNFAMWLVPSLVIAWIYAEVFKTKKRSILLTMVIILTELVRGSATGFMGVLIFLILIFVPYIRIILTPFRSIILVFIAFVVIVLMGNMGFLEPIVEMLGKDMTFSGRVVIWENAIEAIKDKPILGYGILENNEVVKYLGRVETATWLGATHCHCQFLQLVFQGGFIAAIFIVLVYILVIKEGKQNWDIRLTRYGIYGVVVYTIMGIVEVVENPLMFMLFPLAYYIAKLREASNRLGDLE